jgi:hypothetical protein
LERTVAESGVSDREIVVGPVRYAVAGRTDEGELRRLLRSNATDGWIRLAFAREPDAFAAAAIMGPFHGYIIARDLRTLEPVGMCEWSARECFIDGEPRLLAYLGALRVAPRYRHRLSVLKGGFTAVQRLLHNERATPYALTAIAADNHVALRLLGANLAGLPSYRPLKSVSTFALRPRSTSVRPIVERARADDLPAIADCLDRSYREYQFAPVWRARDLADPKLCPGLKPEDFLVVRRGSDIAACVALWDQGAFKQTIVDGYAGRVSRLRPAINLAAPFLRTPRLPAAGEALQQVYLSHLAVPDDDGDTFHALVDASLAEAQRRGHALALLGLATRHPLADWLRRHYRPREYRAWLHLVQWNGADKAQPDVRLSDVRLPDARLPHVEIAVL